MKKVSISKPVTVTAAIQYLNEINQLDPSVLPFLLTTRVACNTALAAHPTVQVGGGGGGVSINCLSILNGMFGVDEKKWGYITAVLEEGRILRFERTTHV